MWYKIAKTLLLNIIYVPCILFEQTLKLFYGYWIFSKGELRDYGYARFSWLHATIAIPILIIVVWIIILHTKIYKDVIQMNLTELLERERTTKINANKILKTHPWIAILPLLLPSPYIASIFFQEWSVGAGVGVGFFMWLLACLWFLIASLYFPKFIICLKHRNLLNSIK